MNLKEVKKNVVFNLLLYCMLGLCLILSLLFILFYPIKTSAKEISNTVNIRAANYMPCNTTLNSGYCAYNSNNTYNARSVGSTYNGVLNGITFQFGVGLSSHQQYILIIEGMSTDFRNNSFSVDVYASSQSDTLGSLLSSYSYSFISKSKIQIILYSDNYNYHTIILTGSPLTGVNTYGIKNVTLSYDDGVNDNSDIINNNTQNTNDIIDNNNSNTETIVGIMENNASNISDLLGSVCTNVFNPASYVDVGNANVNYANANSISATTTGTFGRVSYSVLLSPNTNYYLDFKVINSQNEASFFVVQDGISGDTPVNYAFIGTGTSNHITFTSSSSGIYNIHLYASTGYYGNTTQWYDIMLSPYNKPYCTYGKLISRFDGIEGAVTGGLSNVNDTINNGLEEVKDLQQDQYNYLTDNSDPSVNTSGINNVIGSVQVQDPLNYLLTLPINLLSKLNTLISSGTCTKASFGELYGTELYLPCINFENYLGSSLWTTIDTIVGIGLLVIIIKKFYDTISNILSLGKEEEIRKGMELPTPMEFLAKILGGGS